MGAYAGPPLPKAYEAGNAWVSFGASKSSEKNLKRRKGEEYDGFVFFLGGTVWAGMEWDEGKGEGNRKSVCINNLGVRSTAVWHSCKD